MFRGLIAAAMTLSAAAEAAPCNLPGTGVAGLGNGGCGCASLQDAITNAPIGGTVYLRDSSGVNESVTIDQDLQVKRGDLFTCMPNGPVGPTIDLAWISGLGLGARPITVTNGAHVEITGIHIMDGTDDEGGLILMEPSTRLTLIDVLAERGEADSGGCISMREQSRVTLAGTTKLEACGFSPDGKSGGAVFMQGLEGEPEATLLRMTGTSSIVNTLTPERIGSGGAVYAEHAAVEMRDLSTIDGSSAFAPTGGFGGSIYLSTGSLEMYEHSSIRHGSSVYQGGCVHLDKASSLIMRQSSTIEACTAGLVGGGAINAEAGSTVTLRAHAAVRDGRADRTLAPGVLSYGGCVRVDQSEMSMSARSTVSNCPLQGDSSAADHGGGIAVTGEGASLQLSDRAHVRDNTALVSGGGIYLGEGAAMVANGAPWSWWAPSEDSPSWDAPTRALAVSDNDVDCLEDESGSVLKCAGGGVHVNAGGTLEAKNLIVSGNSVRSPDRHLSATFGGGIAAEGDSELELVNSVVSENWSDGDGGGIAMRTKVDFQYPELVMRADLDSCPPGSLSLEDRFCSEVRSNHAAGVGAGIQFAADTDREPNLTLLYTAVQDNTAVGEGAPPFESYGVGIDGTGGEAVTGEPDAILVNVLVADNTSLAPFAWDAAASFRFRMGVNVSFSTFVNAGRDGLYGTLLAGTVRGNVLQGGQRGFYASPASTLHTLSKCNVGVFDVQPAGPLGIDNNHPNVLDPGFASWGRSSYELGVASHAADVCLIGALDDLNGDCRPGGQCQQPFAGLYDAGAFERQ